jgi:pilus assembly protein CpaE
MSRLITVFIECKTDAVRHVFQETFARKPGYIVTQAKQAGAADVLILELDEANPQRTFSSIRSTVSATSQTEIFLTAGRTDTQIMLEAFRLGVKEFIPQPINAQEMEAALGRLEERLCARVPIRERKAGKVVSIIGAKGGVGASTVATNLSVTTRHVCSAKSVALMDLNLQNSDLTLFLDLPASGGLRDLSQDLSRLDETILQSVIMKHKSGIDLLPSGYDGLNGMTPASGCVTHTLDLMQSLYDCVFIDCGHALETSKEALDFSSIIILVTTLNVPAVRRTKQLLDAFGDAHYDSNKIMLVVNRYSARDEELLRHTEETLRHKVYGLIPNDYASTNRAGNDGQPLTMVAPRAAITQWYLRQGSIFGGNDQENQHEVTDQKNIKRGSFLTRYLPGLGLDAKAKFQSS